MEIEGKIIVKLPPQSGTSKAGNAWNKQEYVLETMEAYPKKVCFILFGDRANQYPMEVGDYVRVSFDIESREFNGRWYTDIRAWKAEKVDPNAPQQQAPAQAMPAAGPAPAGPAPTGPAPMVSEEDFTQGPNDDLPF